jgi:hypothetical protein
MQEMELLKTRSLTPPAPCLASCACPGSKHTLMSFFLMCYVANPALVPSQDTEGRKRPYRRPEENASVMNSELHSVRDGLGSGTKKRMRGDERVPVLPIVSRRSWG